MIMIPIQTVRQVHINIDEYSIKSLQVQCRGKSRLVPVPGAARSFPARGGHRIRNAEQKQKRGRLENESQILIQLVL
jgi:hypothetical protein